MRKIHRRNFLKAAGILSAAVAGSLMTGCGGSDAGTQAAASNLTPYNELTVGTDHTDLTATIKVINHRTDLIQDGTFDGYVAEFQKLYPNITIEYEGITDYAGDMTTRLTSQEWGDVCMIPTTAPDEIADLAVNVQQEAELMLNADQTHVMRIVEAGINGDETIDDIVADWNEAWNRGVERYAPEA